LKPHFALIAAALIATTGVASDPIDRLETSPASPFRVSGKGVINDAGHPMHPGDFRPIEVAIRIAIDPAAATATIEVDSGEGEAKETDR